MNTPDNTDPDALLTRRAIAIHRKSREFATQQLEKLTPEKCRAIAYDALYFAASSRFALCYPEAEPTDYARGYIQATTDILGGVHMDLILTALTKLD